MKEKTKYRINQKQAAADFDRKLRKLNIGVTIMMYIIFFWMIIILMMPRLILNFAFTGHISLYSFLEQLGDFGTFYTSPVTNEREFTGLTVLFTEMIMVWMCVYIIIFNRFVIAIPGRKTNIAKGASVYGLLRYIPVSIEEMRKRRMIRVLILSLVLYIPGLLSGIWLYFNPVNISETTTSGGVVHIAYGIEKQYYLINEIFRFLLMFVLPMATGYLMNLWYESALYRRRKIK